jgi:hypothetical protein
MRTVLKNQGVPIAVLILASVFVTALLLLSVVGTRSEVYGDHLRSALGQRIFATRVGSQQKRHPIEPCCTPRAGVRCITGSDEIPTFGNPARRLRVGFVTYATGPYNSFIPGLWKSLRERAFIEHDVHLFLFSDLAGNASFLPGDPNVHKRQQSRLGWPFDSLARHFLFLSAKDWFQGMDYLISVDADSVLEGTLNDSVLGERIAAIQAWLYGHSKSYWTLDRRRTVGNAPYSSSFATDNEATCYFTGNLFGGSYAGFLQLLQEIVDLARRDLESYPRRVALWHDETYLNKALYVHPPTVIWGAHFMYPEPPADEWLYSYDATAAGHDWSRMLWLGPKIRGRRFAASRKFLNLGVRKHALQKVAEFQPLSGVLPALMSSFGAEALFPLPVALSQLSKEVVFLVRVVSEPLPGTPLAIAMEKWCVGICCSFLLQDGSVSSSTLLQGCSLHGANAQYAVVLGMDAALLLRAPPLTDAGAAQALAAMVYVLESSGGIAAPFSKGKERNGFDVLWGCISSLQMADASETVRALQLVSATDCGVSAVSSFAYDSYEAVCEDVLFLPAKTTHIARRKNGPYNLGTRTGRCVIRELNLALT